MAKRCTVIGNATWMSALLFKPVLFFGSGGGEGGEGGMPLP